MTLLTRYIMKNNAMLLILLCVVIATLYCIFNFIDNKSSMTLAPSFWVIIQYYLLSIPYIITLLFSLLFFLSVVIQCTLMVKNKEFLALISSGISLEQIMSIFFSYSLLLVVISFIITETGIIAEQHAREIYRYEIRQRPKIPHTFTNIWLTTDHNFIHFGKLTPSIQEIESVTLYIYSPDMKSMRKHITAQNGTLRDGNLILHNVKQIDVTQSQITTMDFLTFPFTIDIHAIEVANTKLTELTLFDIIRSIHALNSIGFDTTQLYSALHSRITNSLSIIIMGILAVLIGLNIANSYVAIGISFLTAVVFFLSRQLLESLARLNIVNPSLAPWLLLIAWSIVAIIIAYRTLNPRA